MQRILWRILPQAPKPECAAGELKERVVVVGLVAGHEIGRDVVPRDPEVPVLPGLLDPRLDHRLILPRDRERLEIARVPDDRWPGSDTSAPRAPRHGSRTGS